MIVQRTARNCLLTIALYKSLLVPAIFSTSSFVILSVHNILNVLRKGINTSNKVSTAQGSAICESR